MKTLVLLIIILLPATLTISGCASANAANRQMPPPTAIVTVMELEPDVEFTHNLTDTDGTIVPVGMKGRGTARWFVSPPYAPTDFEQSPDGVHWVDVEPLDYKVLGEDWHYKHGVIVFQMLTNLDGTDATDQKIRFKTEATQ